MARSTSRTLPCHDSQWRAVDHPAEARRSPRPRAPHCDRPGRYPIVPHEHSVHRRHRRTPRPRSRATAALRGLIEHYDIDLVIANAENSANGFGITRDIGETLLEWGVDVMTSGNHIWDKKEVLEYIGTQPRLLRPANYPAGVPGRGSCMWPKPATAARSASST